MKKLLVILSVIFISSCTTSTQPNIVISVDTATTVMPDVNTDTVTDTTKK